jgi:acetylornithine deacetylase/succinyl-diaminopimelate desuccinylase-like protein
MELVAMNQESPAPEVAFAQLFRGLFVRQPHLPISLSSRAPASETLPAMQQEIARLAALPEVRAAMEWFRDQEAQFTRWQLEVARIAAPPFGESARSEWLAEQFAALGLGCIEQDSLGNVFGSQSAVGDSCISISAHLDTVFPAGTALDARQQGRKLYGPSVSDNSAGITALLAVADAVVRFGLLPGDSTPGSLLFIGNVGEEGEGDLRGMRHIFSDSQWKDKITGSVVVDGAGTDTIVAEALGSRRFEVTLRGPGGHSWSDFGAPNPIVALARAIHLFSQTRVSSSPKTTFNIGVIQGGTSVNSIPQSASMRVDIRSTSAFEIERLELELRSAVEHAIEEEETRSSASDTSLRRAELDAEIVAIGNRPAGELPPNARILQIARSVDACLSNTAKVQRASTDANIPISLGREAIAIGAGGAGGGAHTLHEWFDPAGRELGLRRILLIVLALAGTVK